MTDGWIMCPECGWRGRVDELGEFEPTSQCPACLDSDQFIE